MKQKFRKQLTLVNVFCLAAGTMISSGLFILPGMAFASAGPAMILSYAAAGLLALTGVLNFTELSTAMPKAGGDYYYVNRSMGAMLGTISGVMSWFALSLKTAFAVYGIAKLLYISIGVGIRFSAVCVCLGFVVLNVVWERKAIKLDVILVLGLIIGLVLYFLPGFTSVAVSNFDPFLPNGVGSIFYTTGFVFVAFGGGLLKISSVAEEVVEPQRNIPLGMAAAVLVITGLYVILLVVTVGVLPAEQLATSLTPVADAAKIFMGEGGFIVVSVASMLAFITTANAGIMAASRYPVALSRDNLLPKTLAHINPRFHTPARSVILTGLFIILSLFLPLDVLVKVASTVILISYILGNIAIIILRESGLQNYRPTFRVPLYPWLQIVTIFIFVFLISDMGRTTVKIGIGLVIVSALLYFFYGMKRSKVESALIHLVARIGNKNLDSYNLESELKEVIHHRDDVVLDNFDEIVSRALVLDVDGAQNKDTLFVEVAKELQDRIKVKQDVICSLLTEREELSSTAIIPTVAIPHIIIDGEEQFDLALIRCREGVYFTENAEKVTAIFVIIGTRDKRRLHLQALAAIAQVIQQDNFDELWDEAKDDNLLRDVFLLSKRRRV